MKKNTILTLMAICISLTALLMGFGAKKADTMSSWYDNRDRNTAILVYDQTVFFSDSIAMKMREGFVTLQGDIFIPQWTGLMNVSGSCALKREPVRFLIILEAESNNYILADTPATAAAFNVTIPAEPVRIGLKQESQVSANAFQCNILFQAVK